MRMQGRTVCMDATASTNKHKFALTTIMVCVPDGPALPVAWLLHSSNSEATLLLAVNSFAEQMGPQFTPTVVLLDDAIAEINAIHRSLWCAPETPRGQGFGWGRHAPGMGRHLRLNAARARHLLAS